MFTTITTFEELKNLLADTDYQLTYLCGNGDEFEVNDLDTLLEELDEDLICATVEVNHEYREVTLYEYTEAL